MNDQLRKLEEDQVKSELGKVMILAAILIFTAGLVVGIAGTLIIQSIL